MLKFRVKCKEYDQEVVFDTEVDNLDELTDEIYNVRMAIYKAVPDVIDKVNKKDLERASNKLKKTEKPASDAQKKLLKRKAPMIPVEKIESLSSKEASNMIDELFAAENVSKEALEPNEN